VKRICSPGSAVVTAAFIVAAISFAADSADDEGFAIFGVQIPPGYREWQLVGVAHEAGNLNDIRTIPGNAVAVKAFRDVMLPFRDGTIIARLAWKDTPSDENNVVLGGFQSFVPLPATNVQFMVKHAKEVCQHGRLGIRSIRRRQTQPQRGLAPSMLPAPPARETPRFRLYA